MSGEGEENTEVVDRRELLAQQLDAVEEEKTHGPSESISGKFAKRPDEGQQTQAEGQQEEEPLWKRPPNSWKKDYHEVWKTADPRLQEYAWQREEQMRAGVVPLIPKAELADKIQQAAEPYMNTIHGLNMDIPTAVAGLMKADHELRTLPYDQKVQRAVGILQAYGIDLNAVAGAQRQMGIAPDPNYYALQNELLAIKGNLTAFQQQQEMVQNQAILTDINKFAANAEHFEEVRPTMVQLLNTGLAGDLQEAYDKAIRLDPNLSEAIEQRKQAQANQTQRAVTDRAAKAAKAAAVSVKTSTPGAKTTSKAQDRRSMLLEQFDSLSERF
jgi:hypothetical protein